MEVAAQQRVRADARVSEAAQIRGGARPFIDFARRRHVHLGTLMGGIDAHPEQFGSPHHWIPYRTLRRLHLNSRRIFGDPEVAFQIGLESMRDTGLGFLQPLVPAALAHLGLAPALRRLSLSLSVASTYCDLEIIGSGRGSALTALARYRTEASPLLADCLYLRGTIAGVATQWGHAPGTVRERFCTISIVTLLREEFAIPTARDLHFEDGLLFLGDEQIGRRVLLASEEIADPAPAGLERLRARPPQPLPRISAPAPGHPQRRHVAAPQIRDVPPHEIDPEDPHAAVLLTRDVIAGQAPDSVVLEAGRIFNAACCRYEVSLLDEEARRPALARALAEASSRAFSRRGRVRQGLMAEMIAQMEENARRAERISALNLALEARYQEVERARQALLNINEHLQLQLHRRGEALTQVRSELDLSKEQLDRLLGRLRQTEAQLIHQGKMAALGQLVAGISHELRTPIQAIVSHSRNLGTVAERILGDLAAWPAELGKRLGPVAEEKTRTFIEDGSIGRLSTHLTALPRALAASAHQINGLINSLRQFSRTDESVRATLHLREMIQDTLRVASLDLARKVEVSVELDEELPPIHCSPSQINQVLLNMLVNAAQAVRTDPASAADGLVRGQVRLRGRVLEPGWVRLEIADNGVGIPEEHRTRIFEPFFTFPTPGKASGEGAGLGLSIAQRIVCEEHGGRIAVESEVGRGTTFLIDLPTEPVMAPQGRDRVAKEAM
ncbi:MAG TPA: ATP-binding protein [Polyangia bacterium]|jgi:signal transduction histidine kinase|nr:ATP-binding protein [Polyangia bacterium]